MEYCRQAIGKDPGYARAYGAVATTAVSRTQITRDRKPRRKDNRPLRVDLPFAAA
jgi:hypothetical protein